MVCSAWFKGKLDCVTLCEAKTLYWSLIGQYKTSLALIENGSVISIVANSSETGSIVQGSLLRTSPEMSGSCLALDQVRGIVGSRGALDGSGVS